MAAKLLRKIQKIFGENAALSEIAKFGSYAANNPAFSIDPDEIQTGNYLGGWASALIGNNSPAREDMNALFYLLSRQLAYVYQNGIPEYDPAQEYFQGSYVTVGYQVYVSVANNNIGQSVLNPVYWRKRTILDSQGDLIYADNEGFEARLPIGDEGQSLTVRAGVPVWEQTVPVGIVQPFAGIVAPTGYLLCNGQAVSRTVYANLFAVIGTSHGQGDNLTTFNVPDYRGRFLRGVDGTANRDPDKLARTAMNPGGNTGNNVGSVQSDALQNITGAINGVKSDNNGSSASGAFTHNGYAGDGDGGESRPCFSVTFSAANSPGARTSTETRPTNANVSYIIKY